MHTGVTLSQTAADSAGAAPPTSAEAQFRTSVMLWTLGTDVPFDQRLEQAARAGYRAVELAGEYAAWSDDDSLGTTTSARPSESRSIAPPMWSALAEDATTQRTRASVRPFWRMFARSYR